MSNLPNFPHASKVYSRAYRVLENMGRNGHATAPKLHKTTHRVLSAGTVSDEMQALVDALNDGDEAQIKGLMVQDRYLRYLG